MLSRPHLIAALLAACSLLPASPASATGYAQRTEVQGFIEEMVQKHGFERTELDRVFAQARLRDDIVEAISRPAESKPWHQYRPIFLTDDRIRGGVEFWARHAEVLAAAEREFGVPPHVIVAILGVETRYGRHTGRYRIIDALSTLAFDYPPRAPFFRGQLSEYLIMAREERVDPLELYGSYAGAMGQPQFIPSSFRHYAVDFDSDGRRDLWENVQDVVGSVANYFRVHGWRNGAPVAHRARVRGDVSALLAKGLEPTIPARELAAAGVQVDTPLPPDEAVALVRLEGEDGPEYWVTRHNFYVITRYNRSPLYAMAVYQLGEAVRSARAERS